jgi:acetylornithine deacetylase/succinyl-diaminopimelate desuccinylase-like protein
MIRRVTGISPERGSGSTDCNVPLAMGIPAVCFGLCTGSGAHTREEYVDIDSISVGLKLVYETGMKCFEG